MADTGKIARKLFEAVTSGDTATIQSLQHDDIVMHIPGKNQLSGTHKGKAETGTNLGKMASLTGGTIKRELHDVTSSDMHAVVLARITAQRGGKSFSYNSAVVLDIRDGKVAEQWMLNDDQATVDQVFA
jgi:ketosteroid isomerase-like protein